MKIYKNIFMILCILLVMLFMFQNVYATSGDFWNSAYNWFSKVNTKDYNENTTFIIDEFTNIIRLLGTLIITGATIFLGVKYIFGSVESKADVKEGLFTLLVVCVFFFGWQSLSTLLFPGNRFIFNAPTYELMAQKIFATFTYVMQFLVIIGILYVGVRYIFAGAQGKSELKAKTPMFFIGIILALCSTTVLSFISDVIIETIQ